ncbi:MAG: hypothetical protein A2166_03105 [Omnitrophica WOR_2 bacterium RBG_13_41_10]|nr:MAG: hypothetical protein A2166_03105 [Omnitrophica WOR_2 bacterium RBG_13_41_10]
MKKKIIRPLVYDEPIVSKDKLSAEKKKVLEIAGSGKKVLEIGCSTGLFTKHLYDQGCTITVIEIDEESAKKAKRFAESVIISDIEDPTIWSKLSRKFDVILFMHVLEHLVDPWRVLCEAKNVLAENGFVIILLPNVACWEVRKNLFFKGCFRYQKYGVLDISHLRFFDLYTAYDLIQDAGYIIKEYGVSGSTVPLAGKLRNLPFLKILAPIWERIMIKRYPNLCGAHLFFKATIDIKVDE